TGTWTSVRVIPSNTDYVELAAYGGLWVYRPSGNSLISSLFCSNDGSTTGNCTAASGISSSNIRRTSIAVDPIAANERRVEASIRCLTSAGGCPTTSMGTGCPCPVAWWGMWESTDYGATYHPRLTPMDIGTEEFGQTFFDNVIAVDPLDDSYVYIGLVDI